MITTHEIKLDLTHRGCDPIIQATQGDTNAHQLCINITRNYKKWAIPAGLSALVHYSNAYGSGGSYNTLPDGSPAGKSIPNGICVTLVPEMMALPGSVRITVTLQYGQHLLSPISILLMVAPLASANSPVLANYSNIAGYLPTANTAKVDQVLQVRAVDNHGHITEIQAIDLPEVSGSHGRDGITPHIGSNGNWYLGEEDTGVRAAGENGYTPIKGTDYFDGKDGYTPVKGTDYFDGKDGYTPVKGIDYFDGKDGYTPVKGIDYFDGKDGSPGYTPVRGVDYYTDADKTDFETYIATELAKREQMKPEFANSIEECTDTAKLYILPDGYIYVYMPNEVEVEGYKNWIPYSTVSGGGSIYNGTGYKIGYRMNSSGQEKELTDSIVFGFIPVTKNSVLRIKNFSNNDLPRLQHSANYIHLYNSSYTLLTTSQQGSGSFVMRNNCMDETTGICTVKLSDILDNDDIAFVRVSSLATINGGTATEEDAAKFIITVDQEITENAGSTAMEYIWTNTGHAFVPADYEDRIIDVEKTAGDNAARIKVLEASADTEANVPEYWMSHLEEKAKQIQIAMEDAGRNKSAFLWYTDAHWVNGNSKMSPMLLKYLYKNTPMNKVNFGGDIIGDSLLSTREAMGYLYEWRRMIKDLPNHHSVLGNHDNFRSDNVDYEDDNFVYSFLIAPEESADMVMGGDFYYYIDNPCEKTRYLYLDSGKLAVSDAETAFIIKALKDTPDGWHIVAISHIWFQYSNVSTPTVGSIPAYCQKMLNLFDAYNSREDGNITMVSTANTYDFTHCGGKVEFCIGGHLHVDYDISSTDGIPVILTAADVNQERSYDETEDSGTTGTNTESAVFGIVANYDSRIVSVIAVGRGTNRSIPF